MQISDPSSCLIDPLPYLDVSMLPACQNHLIQMISTSQFMSYNYLFLAPIFSPNFVLIIANLAKIESPGCGMRAGRWNKKDFIVKFPALEVKGQVQMVHFCGTLRWTQSRRAEVALFHAMSGCGQIRDLMVPLCPSFQQQGIKIYIVGTVTLSLDILLNTQVLQMAWCMQPTPRMVVRKL